MGLPQARAALWSHLRCALHGEPWGLCGQKAADTRVVEDPKAGAFSSGFKGVPILAAPREELLPAVTLPSILLSHFKILFFFLLTTAIHACDTELKYYRNARHRK